MPLFGRAPRRVSLVCPMPPKQLRWRPLCRWRESRVVPLFYLATKQDWRGTLRALRYPDSVEFLYALGNEIRTVKFGLDSIRVVLEALGDPQDAFRSIHVAGTNGKGSTCAMIEAVLRANGMRTGLFTSPHLVEPVERIRIAGVPVTRDAFTDAFVTVHRANEQLTAEGSLGHHTTYFETVTAMGFLLFRQAKVDVAVVEVGLGGRLDATNVLTPELTVITPIDFDHEQYLGNSLELIAGEKAGILKRGVPAVFASQRPEAETVLRNKAAELQIATRSSEEYEVHSLRLHARGSEFTLQREDARLHIRCPLAGAFQVENARTAVAALECFGVTSEAIEAGIPQTVWPGRLEVISHSPEIILDGAHNPAGARALAAHITEFYKNRPVWLIYGAMRDKSVEEITEILFPLADELVLTAPASHRAVRPEVLASAAEPRQTRIAPSARDALALARSVRPEDVVFITGSLYLVGEIRALLE
jgi:dihydrofolate synthase / folylpolyglutamate synthase